MALKPTSSVFTIGASVQQTTATSYDEQTIDLQLNPLDNEVLAIYSVDLQPDFPEMIQGVNTRVTAQLTRRSQSALIGIDNNDAIALADFVIRSDATGAVGFSDRSLSDTPDSAAIQEIAIVATSDLYLAIDATGNTSASGAKVKIWARRMKADAATYAALVQSELNSN